MCISAWVEIVLLHLYMCGYVVDSMPWSVLTASRVLNQETRRLKGLEAEQSQQDVCSYRQVSPQRQCDNYTVLLKANFQDTHIKA